MYKRIYTIDYLRGILALMIMLYHYMTLQNLVVLDSNSFLTRVAFYGVSLFFMISGFSLSLNYIEKFKNLHLLTLKKYFLKRIIRIYPLFWLILIFYLSILYLGHKEFPSFLQILSNFTLTFAFFSPIDGLTMGSWSIGIEIIFYFFFPFLIYFVNRFPKRGFTTLIIFIFFSLYLSATIYENSDLKNFWEIYLGLINHLYFFMFGILFAYLYIKKSHFFNIQKKVIIAILFLIMIFVFSYQVELHNVHLVSNMNRIVFSFLIVLLFLLVVAYNRYINIKSYTNKLANHLGEISYTVYLLHPITHRFTHHIMHFFDIKISAYLQIISMSLITIILSTLIHKYYEMKIKEYILGKIQ